MTKGEKDTLINEVQYIADFFNEIQKEEMQRNAPVYTIGDVRHMEEVFAKFLVRVIHDWTEKTYGDPKRIWVELVDGLIGKQSVAFFSGGAEQQGSDGE